MLIISGMFSYVILMAWILEHQNHSYVNSVHPPCPKGPVNSMEWLKITLFLCVTSEPFQFTILVALHPSVKELLKTVY